MGRFNVGMKNCLGRLGCGGLGVKDLEWFNLSLLGNWKWKMFSGSQEFLRKVVESRYGESVWKEERVKKTCQDTLHGVWMCKKLITEMMS
jgi:hypothetical protein